MLTDELNNSHIIAEDGKLLRRISDGLEVGKEIYLGYTHYIDGKKLETPLLEKAEDYEEIDDETPLFDENDSMSESPSNEDDFIEDATIVEEEFTEQTETSTTARPTVADYYDLKRQVDQLSKVVNRLTTP